MGRAIKSNPMTVRIQPMMLAEGQAAVDASTHLRSETHAANTTRQYESRAKHWYKWCEGKAWPLRDTVTPTTALMFLYEHVLAKHQIPASPDINKCLQESSEVVLAVEGIEQDFVNVAAAINQPTLSTTWSKEAPLITSEECLALVRNTNLSPSSFNQWMAALVDIWKSQVSRGVNSYETPRSPWTAAIASALNRFKHEREVKTFVDKGLGQYYNGYKDIQDIIKTYDYYLTRNSETSLRDACAHALGMFALLRSDNQRKMCLSDMSCDVLTQEGPTLCPVIVFATNEGKTNHSGKTQYAAFMRNAKLEMCPVWFLSLYLFARFDYDVSASRFPSFETRASWYPIKLLENSRNASEPVPYETQRVAIKAALKHSGIRTTQATHINRKAGARLAELAGAPSRDVARAGNWHDTVLEKHYLMHIALPALRASAGFKPNGGSFHLPRAVKVPPTLVRKVFPQLDRWMAFFNLGKNTEEDLAARAFLRCLDELRTSFLQDAPHWRRSHPTLFVFRHLLFQDPEYLDFERMALASTAKNQSAYDTRLETALPVLVDELRKRDQASKQQLDHVDTAINKLTLANTSSGETLKAVLCMVGTIQQALSRPLLISPPLDSLGRTPTSSSPLQSGPFDQRTLAPSLTGAPSDQHHQPDVPLVLLTPYQMDRNVATVKDLWTEYTIGINGRASIRSQYEGDDQTWKKTNDAERKFYSRRAPIWRLIQTIIETRQLTSDEAVVLVERQRLALPSKSLNALSDWIKRTPASASVLL